MLKKCIGIVSYFPENDDERQARTKRIARFNGLLNQISTLGPNIDILIIAQNGKDYQLPAIQNKTDIVNFKDPLTIIGARIKLQEEFLKRDYDYIILLDDDAGIEVDNEHAAQDYLDELDKHPNGFCFIHSLQHWHTMDDYAPAPLNLCAISRFIFEKEPMPDMVLEKNEALEDDVYAVLLHIKYADYEFLPPGTIRHNHFNMNQYSFQYNNPDKFGPSTGNKKNKSNLPKIYITTRLILNYIVTNKELPDKSGGKK